MARKVTKRQAAVKNGYRSGLEEIVDSTLKQRNIDGEYEKHKIKYIVPATDHTYTPDFRLPNGIFVETKGRKELFEGYKADRGKNRFRVNRQYPEMMSEEDEQVSMKRQFVWLVDLLDSLPITIFGDGTQKRAFSYIDDSLEPLFNAAVEPKASKQIINLGGIYEYTINEAADTLLKVFRDGNKVYLEGRHEVHTAIPTFQKSIDILGFKHETNLKEGLTKMWQWAQQQPKRDRFIWENYELDKGIYSFWK